MNLQSPDPSSLTQGKDVVLLRRELQQLGYVIKPAEIEQKIFHPTYVDC
jgi:hypothetical protein